MAVPDAFKLFQAVEDSPLDGCGICTVLCESPVKMAIMEPAGICRFGCICFVSVVVKLSKFVSASNYRNSWKREKQCVEGYIEMDSSGYAFGISLIVIALNS